MVNWHTALERNKFQVILYFRLKYPVQNCTTVKILKFFTIAHLHVSLF